MIVRPPFFHPDTLGNPAIEWRVYVGKPNLSPRQEINQLDVLDLETGNQVSQPYFINVDGYPVNSNGQKITPVIDQQEYSLRFESPAGGSPFEWKRLIGDGLSGSDGGGGNGIPDAVLNNLQQGLGQDLNAANYVFIKAENSGWEGTATGADISSFYYRDGTVDIPSAGTGDSGQWFDAAGVRYTLAKSVQEQANEAAIASIDTVQLLTKQASLSGVLPATPAPPQTALGITGLESGSYYSLDLKVSLRASPNITGSWGFSFGLTDDSSGTKGDIVPSSTFLEFFYAQSGSRVMVDNWIDSSSGVNFFRVGDFSSNNFSTGLLKVSCIFQATSSGEIYPVIEDSSTSPTNIGFSSTLNNIMSVQKIENQ